MGTSRHILDEARRALELNGMGAGDYARVIAKMACGYREVIDADRAQLARCEALEAKGQTRNADRYRPKVATLTDEEGAEPREVLLVDETTQLRALRRVAETLGITANGVNINIGAGGGEGGRLEHVGDLGTLVVLLDSAPPAIDAAVRALPAHERRRLTEALLDEARRATSQPVELIEEGAPCPSSEPT